MKTPQAKFEWPKIPHSHLKLIYFSITSFCCAITAFADAIGVTIFFGLMTAFVFISVIVNDDDDKEEA